MGCWFHKLRKKLPGITSRQEDGRAGVEERTSGLGPEVPIRTAAEDRLRRSPYAARIARVLMESGLGEGRVFAIRGGWGHGKSSLKNLVIEQLDTQQDGASRLDFNPWQWGDGDTITRALFSQIADLLGGEQSKKELARADALRRYSAILNGAAAPLKSVSNSALIGTALTSASVVAVSAEMGVDLPSAAVIGAALALLAFASPIAGRVLAYIGRDRRGEPLDKVREGLESQLRELKRPLIVFVDDIDRLEPAQIRLLLRQVKANANLPNIVFVLLFQPSIVENALSGVAGGDGSAFLEKIVQANFDLPSVPMSTVHRLFGEELGAMAGPYATPENGFSEVRWANVFIGCIQPLLRNMRDARRNLASIAIHFPMHLVDDVFEVNIVDFLLLEALRVAEPKLHEVLFRERDLVLQVSRGLDVRRQEETRAAVDALLMTVSLSRRDVAREALMELFPQLAWAFGGMTYGAEFSASWLAEKRVCSQRYFARYFELQTGVGEMSERRFVSFIEETVSNERLEAALAGLERDGLLNSLSKRLDESVDRLPVDNASVLLPAMFSFAQRFAGRSVGDAFSSPWLSAWRATSWYLKRIPEATRGELALRALEDSGALSVGAMLIHLSDPDEVPAERRVRFEPTLNAADLDALKSAWLRVLAERIARDGDLLDDPDLVSHLYRWAKYAGSIDAAKAWVAAATETDQSFVKFVSRMAIRGMTQTFGDRIAIPDLRFKRETVEELLGIEAAKERIDSLEFSAFSEYNAELEKLKVSLERWLGLREADPFDL